jgi:hypothetical protein
LSSGTNIDAFPIYYDLLPYHKLQAKIFKVFSQITTSHSKMDGKTQGDYQITEYTTGGGQSVNFYNTVGN